MLKPAHPHMQEAKTQTINCILATLCIKNITGTLHYITLQASVGLQQGLFCELHINIVTGTDIC
jgi:hypothetical protein